MSNHVTRRRVFKALRKKSNDTNHSSTVTKIKTPNYSGAIKIMDPTFTGYTVFITCSKRRLDRTDELFTRFSGIMLRETSGNFCYFIGKFKTIAGARKYADTVVKQYYQDAQAVFFENEEI